MGPTEAVLTYLKAQNRPYSANDITQNLHKEFGKTAIQKALDELVKDEKIREKIYGKQKVYAPIQDDYDSTDPGKIGEELTHLDATINATSERLNKAEKELKSQEAILKELKNMPTTAEAIKEKQELDRVVLKLREKFQKVSTSTIKISQKEKDVICKEHERILKEYRKRKRMCTEIVDSILENYPKNKKALMEEVGIETEEEAGCSVSK